ncbi:protein-tyrosine phosphatase [Anaerobranca californiensis DSM 14826]|uniref:Protein-tyrosine phosphatase n=1 Tax=Anaerobranca californiensis DSM 14826 TaxID=1120989 RepID=A0A1M6MA25_9FIRM|nr:low molecular weight protein arginine phosphatase [Anaerobranca californiensis]SHJ80291.1 protein-tyrosine phosphatase [Anaerobranca californiensis DSM 14826]
MKILFVCTGNTCRSPMAEAYIKDKIKDGYFLSAGTDAIDNLPASENAVMALKDLGIELKEHRSQRITKEKLAEVDLVLTMTLRHKIRLINQYPEFKDKIFTLKEYAKGIDLEKIIKRVEELESIILQSKNELNNDGENIEEFKSKFQKEIGELQKLYETMAELDVADPFGGTLDDYRVTLQEIKEHIDLIIEKIIKNNN